MRARIRDHIRSNVVGYIALFCFAIGGTAYAVDGPLAGQNTVGSADIINGEVQNKDLGTDAVASGKIADKSVKNADLSIGASSSNTIADGGIQGVDVKANALTGTEIAESGLGKVPDADQFDGIDSHGFIQGGGEALGGFETVPESESREILFHASHQFGGEFAVSYTCPVDANNNGAVTFVNVDALSAKLFADNGSADPSFIGAVEPAGSAGDEQHSEPAAAAGDYITLQAAYPNSVIAVDVFSQHDPASDSCYAQAQAVATAP